MASYRPAGEIVRFYPSIPELEPFAINSGSEKEVSEFLPPAVNEHELISRTQGWVGDAYRTVEVYGNTSDEIIFKIEGGGEYFIIPQGTTICRSDLQSDLQQLDIEILLGPVLVFALALRNIWCLHASAAMFRKKLFVFLGESGQGKSTLAAYLSQQPNWRRVADDIVPVKIDLDGVKALPHFPQLKLPINSQPGVDLAEHLPLNHICILSHPIPEQPPELIKFEKVQSTQALLKHIAGTRMFTPSLLTNHLDFSAQAAKQVTVHELVYPHKMDALATTRKLLEELALSSQPI